MRDLFKILPVRYTEFKKSHKAQLAKCIQLLQQYAVVQTQIKLTVQVNQGDNMPFNPVLRTTCKEFSLKAVL